MELRLLNIKQLRSKRSRHRRLSRLQWHQSQRQFLRFHGPNLQKLEGASEITMSNLRNICGQVAQRDLGTPLPPDDRMLSAISGDCLVWASIIVLSYRAGGCARHLLGFLVVGKPFDHEGTGPRGFQANGI